MDNIWNLINPEGEIENRIVWDGVSEYDIPDGYTLVKA